MYGPSSSFGRFDRLIDQSKKRIEFVGCCSPKILVVEMDHWSIWFFNYSLIELKEKNDGKKILTAVCPKSIENFDFFNFYSPNQFLEKKDVNRLFFRLFFYFLRFWTCFFKSINIIVQIIWYLVFVFFVFISLFSLYVHFFVAQMPVFFEENFFELKNDKIFSTIKKNEMK